MWQKNIYDILKLILYIPTQQDPTVMVSKIAAWMQNVSEFSFKVLIVFKSRLIDFQKIYCNLGWQILAHWLFSLLSPRVMKIWWISKIGMSYDLFQPEHGNPNNVTVGYTSACESWQSNFSIMNNKEVPFL